MTDYPHYAWRQRIVAAALLIVPFLASSTCYAAPQRATIEWDLVAGTAQGRLLAAWVNETPTDYTTTRVMWQRGTDAPVVVARRLQPLYRAKVPLCGDSITKVTAAYGAVSDDYTELVHVDASTGTSFTGDTDDVAGTRSHVAFRIRTAGTVVTSATGAVATMTRPIIDLISDENAFLVITKADDGTPALGTVAGDGVVTIVTTLPQAVS